MNNIVEEKSYIDGVMKVASLDYDWNKLDNKTLLISGGTGFIGSAIIDVIKCRNECFFNDIKVISLSRHKQTDKKNITYLSMDVTKPLDISGNIDYILHLASNTHPAQYAADPVGTIETNVFGCSNLLRLAVEKNIKRFLLASSVEIYGQCADYPVDESFCGYIDCNTVRAGYNESKRVCESLVQSYKSQYGINSVIVRLARCFGRDNTKKDTKAMAQFLACANSGKNIVLKSDGKQRYSYCYYLDAVSGILKVLLDGINGEAYNIAADDANMSLFDIAAYIASLSKTKVIFDMKDAVDGASKATNALLDCTKLKDIGWKPLFSIKEGLERSLNTKFK